MATEAEKLLWSKLRRKQIQGSRFRREYPLGPYFGDFVCLPARLIIEVDGGQHARSAQSAYDAERTAWLAREGFRVVRFWNTDVMNNMDGVLDVIDAAMREPLPLTPSRKGRGY